MRRPTASPLIRTAVAAAVLVAMCVVGGVPGAPTAGALDLTKVVGVLGITTGPDADHPVIGYTLASNDSQSTCELLRIDWATGLTTDLPSTPTADACVTDLAVAPDGTVYGIKAPAPIPPTSITCVTTFCGTTLARLVTFAADGTATITEIGSASTYTFGSSFLGSFYRGIAVDSSGVIHVMINDLWVDVTTCAPGPAPGSVPGSSVADGIHDGSACLFTVDPSSGEMTLVGPSRLPSDVLAGLSIGVDGGRTLSFLLTPEAVGPSSVDVAYWGTVNLGSGEVSPSGTTYPVNNGLFDQLRSGSLIYALVEDPATGGYRTALIDPTTGAITPLTDLVTDLPPRPDPVGPAFTG